ncbi:MAG: glycosyltransferase [Hylemonella sp.]|nr:glycosyltransferase [Hylemonella sp.]MDH5707480.1 glycosyltransferase [Hylemonella sp.]
MPDFLTSFFLLYFIALNGVYLALNALSVTAVFRNNQQRDLDDLPQVQSVLDPPISLLIPAYNEAATIAATVRSALQLTYSQFEIIVINDGSRDDTLQTLVREFSLLPFPEAYRIQLKTQVVRGIYRSTTYPQLRVVDKENGGKADSLNAGINAARYPLFCGVDADSILQRNCLELVSRPFTRNPQMIASGGTIRAANGCEVREGHLTRVGLPRNPLALIQVIEYLRAFLFGRLGWSSLNAMLIISGAFGLFKKDAVIEVGGYRTDTIGEDMELIVRLHHTFRVKRKPYRIEFVPDPVCWTEVPEDFRTLRNQRVRWQRGLSESLNSHWGLMFSRHGGWPGWFAFPFMVLFEWLGPFFEVLGYIWFIYALALGHVSTAAFFVFLFVAIGMGVLLSVSGLLLEEIGFHTYPRLRQFGLLTLFVLVENLGYRQLQAWWRLTGVVQWAIKKESQWGTMKRKGNWQKEKD